MFSRIEPGVEALTAFTVAVLVPSEISSPQIVSSHVSFPLFDIINEFPCTFSIVAVLLVSHVIIFEILIKKLIKIWELFVNN